MRIKMWMNIIQGSVESFNITFLFGEWDEKTGFLVWPSAERAGLLCVGWGRVLWVPPVHELYTVYRVQHHLDPTLIPPFLPSLERWVLEHQTNAVVTHVCANVDREQGQCHAHYHRGEDEVEGCDLKHVAVRVWVRVDIFILSGHAQGLGTTILTVSLLF